MCLERKHTIDIYFFKRVDIFKLSDRHTETRNVHKVQFETLDRSFGHVKMIFL